MKLLNIKKNLKLNHYKKLAYLLGLLLQVWCTANTFAMQKYTLASDIKNNQVKTTCYKKPGYADFYILALSWEKAFCKLHPNKKECNALNTYAQKNFVLHGLWPSQSNCKKYYTFCNPQYTSRFSFCSFPGLQLKDNIAKQLKIIMPGYNQYSCLERYEWYKHGTCQNNTQNDYFSKAIALTKSFNQVITQDFKNLQHQSTIDRSQFYNMINKHFGKNAHQKIQLICNKNFLTEIRIKLPLCTQGKACDFKHLINNKLSIQRGNCPKNIEIIN